MADADRNTEIEFEGHQTTKAPPLFRKFMYKLGFRHPGFEFEDDPSNTDDES